MMVCGCDVAKCSRANPCLAARYADPRPVAACVSQEQKVFVRRIEELDPSIRYCQYNLSKLHGNSGGQNILLQMQQDSSGATSDILKAKLDVGSTPPHV